jgi:hypothetical protein
MPNSSKAADNSIGLGSLNNKGDVRFSLRLAGKPKSGMFLYSGGPIKQLIVVRVPRRRAETLSIAEFAPLRTALRIL